MLNVEIRNSLANIIRQNGKQIARDPVGLQTLLRGEAAQYPREIGMIVNAARAGIPQDIEEAGNAIYDLRPRMVEKLQTEQAFPQDVAEWAVETWISALSVADSAPAAPAVATTPPPPAPIETAPPAAASVAQPTPPPPAAQAPYQAPAQPQYPQYGQFPAQKSGSGKMVAILVISLIVLAGLGVGGYFLFFKGKGSTSVASTSGGTTTGGTNGGVKPDDLFSNGGGANGGGPGTTGGQGANGGGPGTNGGGPGTDTGGANGGGPGTTGGDPGTNAGGTGGDNGGGGGQVVGGTYQIQYDPPQQNSGTGTLTLGQDMSFRLEISAGETTISASGKMAGGGNQIILNCESASVNGKPAPAPQSIKMALQPVDGNRMLFLGVFADAMSQQVPGLKMYWVK